MNNKDVINNILSGEPIREAVSKVVNLNVVNESTSVDSYVSKIIGFGFPTPVKCDVQFPKEQKEYPALAIDFVPEDQEDQYYSVYSGLFIFKPSVVSFMGSDDGHNASSNYDYGSFIMSDTEVGDSYVGPQNKFKDISYSDFDKLLSLWDEFFDINNKISDVDGDSALTDEEAEDMGSALLTKAEEVMNKIEIIYN